MKVERCYHPEYGGYVYQPYLDSNKDWPRFIEPYLTEEEAEAFLDGVKWAREDAKDE